MFFSSLSIPSNTFRIYRNRRRQEESHRRSSVVDLPPTPDSVLSTASSLFDQDPTSHTRLSGGVSTVTLDWICTTVLGLVGQRATFHFLDFRPLRHRHLPAGGI
ncbi:hypothetical protein XPA_000743 [Xanthoria parietina]